MYSIPFAWTSGTNLAITVMISLPIGAVNAGGTSLCTFASCGRISYLPQLESLFVGFRTPPGPLPNREVGLQLFGGPNQDARHTSYFVRFQRCMLLLGQDPCLDQQPPAVVGSISVSCSSRASHASRGLYAQRRPL